MKKILSFLTITLLASVSLFAQDMETATGLYNDGVNALNAGDKTTALQCFEKALAQGEAIGEEAQELIANCKKSIPFIILSIGKEQATAMNINEAVATLQQAVKKATEYGQTDIEEEAKALIPKLYMQQAGTFLNKKDFEKAAESYKKVIEFNPSDGKAYLYLGQALSRMNDFTGAFDALKKAAECGEGKMASTVASKLYLTLANVELKKKDFAKAMNYAEESLNQATNPTALQIAGIAAAALKDHGKTIKYYEKLIEINPNSKNVNELRYTLAASYEAMGDKTNACVNYRAIASVPQFKEFAEFKIKELKCK